MKKKTILTREVFIDSTIPTAGNVLIVTDDRLHEHKTSKLCQVPQSFVEVIIAGFQDADTGIDRYSD